MTTHPDTGQPGHTPAVATADPDELYRAAVAHIDRSAGFYNHNVKVETPDGPAIVRFPIPGADRMDLAIWPEPGILSAVALAVPRTPRLLHASVNPLFEIHRWIDGEALDAVAPVGVPVPRYLFGALGELFGQLGSVGLDQLPLLPDGWPADGDTTAFAHRLSAITADVHARFLDAFGGLFQALGFPADPLEQVIEGWRTLSPRPFRLLHTDIHRKNMIINAGRVFFLDWELALWGDPAYELAVHLHKMAYLADEARLARVVWLSAVPAEATVGYRRDLDAYLDHERVKSAIVDTVRHAIMIMKGARQPATDAALIDRLTAAVGAAHDVWQTGSAPNREGVTRALDLL